MCERKKKSKNKNEEKDWFVFFMYGKVCDLIMFVLDFFFFIIIDVAHNEENQYI